MQHRKQEYGIARDSALRNWLEVPWRSCLNWVVKNEYELFSQTGGLVGNTANSGGGIESIDKVFCWSAACCIGDTLTPATTFPRSYTGLSISSAHVLPFLPSVKTPEKVNLYQEESAWLIPTYLQLLQRRQHSHSRLTGWLPENDSVIWALCFVLEPLTFEE